jgi:hypothetical protein
MNRKKIEIEDIHTLITSFMPKMGNESRHQIHSLLSLVMSTLIITVSFTSTAAANGNFVRVEKTVTDVGGNGPNGHITAANQTINYTINVTNNINELLEEVNISDPLITLQTVHLLVLVKIGSIMEVTMSLRKI